MGKLIGHCLMKGTLTCVEGVRIGGSKDTLEIGGTDNPIIRHPITQLPYIPGSSLKGKIRSLLEQKNNKVVFDRGEGKPCDCGECPVCIIFGCAKARNTKTVTRVIFRDCTFTADTKEGLDKARDQGVFYSETKTEVTIDRKTGKAAKAGPRVQERIPADSKFDLEIVLRVFEEDDLQKHIDFIQEGIDLLEHDTLGGSGSRGYGKVKIDIPDSGIIKPGGE